MRTSFALLLAFVVLLQSGSGAWRVAGYKLNQDFIARNLCVNRAKPQLKCNGKCHLRKQLRHDEQKQKQSGEQESNSSLLFCTILNQWRPLVSYAKSHVSFPALVVAHPCTLSAAIFSPPWHNGRA